MILIKGADEIALMSEAGRIVAEALEAIRTSVVPGITTGELDRLAYHLIIKKGGEPAFKGYRGYPASICSSVNEQVVHGIPSGRKLKQGDIVSIDLGVKYRDYYGDAALTCAVGEANQAAKDLMRATEEALWLGIGQAVPGNRVSDISHAVQKHAEAKGFSVVRSFVGHGIGRSLHEEPQVPNFGPPGKGPRLVKGMALAIEPMVNAGNWQVKVLDDGWTAVTIDGRLSAHYEHTVIITDGEPLVLTKLP
ncbi:MAG: type I methionyl aminopeptidase [Nitrospiraceae bacterium]|nr:type I methionyl aminopeptidase [Nitrospiraceae bacterium]